MLAHPAFLNFGVPLFAVFLTIFLKIVSRNDKFQSFKRDDLAIGPDLSVTALLLFITDSAAKARSLAALTAESSASGITQHPGAARLEETPWFLLFFVILIWGLSTIVRKKGWDANGEIITSWGIVVPGAFGLGALITVVLKIG